MKLVKCDICKGERLIEDSVILPICYPCQEEMKLIQLKGGEKK